MDQPRTAMAATLTTLKGTYINHHSFPDRPQHTVHTSSAQRLCCIDTKGTAVQIKLISERPIEAYLLETVSQQALVFWVCKLQNVLSQ